MDLLTSPARAENNAISLGGIPATELAESYGTPLVVIDTDVLDDKIASFLMTAHRLDIDVAYAGKALLVKALAAHLRDAGLSLDCCSLGEIVTAEAVAFPRERIYLHGCGKTSDEIEAAVDGRVGRVVVDNFEELERLAARSRAESPVSIILRINTGIEAHTHEFVRTAGDDTKFGFAVDDFDRACVFTAAEPGLVLLGLHAHIGSQIMASDPFIANLELLMALYARAHANGHAGMRDIIVGGGFGVAMHPDEVAGQIDPQAILERTAARAVDLAAAAAVPLPRLGIEPGRAIIGEAGTSLYRVCAVKQQGARRFVIVDGGMSDNPRPALYGSYHHPQLASRVSAAPLAPMTVCGRTCENDELVRAELPGDIRTGDILAVRVTGAYTYSMASNYNRFSRPAVVFAGSGMHRLVVRRETAAELLRYDI